jgi:hypothetical protein
VGCCAHGNEPLGSLKDDEYLGQLSYQQHFKVSVSEHPSMTVTSMCHVGVFMAEGLHFRKKGERLPARIWNIS